MGSGLVEPPPGVPLRVPPSLDGHSVFAKDLFPSLRLPQPTPPPFLYGGEGLRDSLSLCGRRSAGRWGGTLTSARFGSRLRRPWAPRRPPGGGKGSRPRALPAPYYACHCSPSLSGLRLWSAGGKGEGSVGAGAVSSRGEDPDSRGGKVSGRADFSLAFCFSQARPLTSSPFGRSRSAIPAHAPVSRFALGLCEIPTLSPAWELNFAGTAPPPRRRAGKVQAALPAPLSNVLVGGSWG